MITYTCNNREAGTGKALTCTGRQCETSVCPECGGRADAASEIYWCSECQAPLYEEQCPLCGGRGSYLTSDLRPVFPEERLLLELIEGRPFCYRKDSVWNGAGNRYFVNGRKIAFSVKRS